MPTVHVITTVDAPPPTFLTSLSRVAADATGKDEKWVMTALTPAAGMTFGGEVGPSCLVRVVSIGGYTDDVAQALIAGLTAQVEEHLRVPRNRVYVELSAAERPRFGWNGASFG